MDRGQEHRSQSAHSKSERTQRAIAQTWRNCRGMPLSPDIRRPAGPANRRPDNFPAPSRNQARRRSTIAGARGSDSLEVPCDLAEYAPLDQRAPHIEIVVKLRV